MKNGKASKANKKATKDSKGKASTASTTSAPKVTSAPKAPKGKASTGYDPKEDGPLHKDHPLVNDLYALSRRFRDHAYHYSDNGAFIVHRILSALDRAISKNQGEDLSKEKGVYSAARSLLRSYGDPMPDEDAKRHPVPFRSLAGRFRILRTVLHNLIRGHEIAHQRAEAYAITEATEKRLAEMTTALRSNSVTGDNAAKTLAQIVVEIVARRSANELLQQESTREDVFSHVFARMRIGQNYTPIDHWRTPANFEDNAWLVSSFVITYFPQICSVRDENLPARIKTYLRTLDERRAQKMAQCQKQGIEYSVNEVADELAYDILHNECKLSGMTETQISNLLGFYLRH